MNGIHEVTGSIPVWSTTLRSPELSELRVASQPPLFSKERQRTERITRRRRLSDRAAQLSSSCKVDRRTPRSVDHSSDSANFSRQQGGNAATARRWRRDLNAILSDRPRHLRCRRRRMPDDKTSRLCFEERQIPSSLLHRPDITTYAPAWPTTTPAAVPIPRGTGPGNLHVTIELPDEQRAVDFERYLKSVPVARLRSAFRMMDSCGLGDESARSGRRLQGERRRSEINGSKSPRFPRTPYSVTSTMPA